MEIDDRYFSAGWMRYAANTKPERDAQRELKAIIKAIENEAYNGNYTYTRGHIFPQNIEYLRDKGFRVEQTDKRFCVSW